MARNRKLLIVLLVLLVLLSGLTIALRLGLFAGEAEPDEEEGTASIPVSAIPTESVSTVTWSGGDSPDFRLEKDIDGTWFCPDEPDQVLDQDKVESTISALCQVLSSREIEEPEDLSAFGLDPAQRRIQIDLADGQTVAYLVGDRNTYTNRFYFQLEGDSAVHLVGYSVGESMNYTVADYLPDEASDASESSGTVESGESPVPQA